MTDEEVTKLLASLPRREASPRFTAAVLKRLEQRGQPHYLRRHPWAVGATVAVVLAGLLLGAHLRARGERLRATERVESLRTEYRELEAEVEKLRSLARELHPVIELGGNERVEFVFDLRELGAESDRYGIEPVSQTSGEKR